MAASSSVTPLTPAEVADALDGFFAWDGGATDSGIQDVVLRGRVRAWLREDHARAVALLGEMVLDTLSPREDGTPSPYTVTVVYEFLEWISEEMEFDL